MPASRWHRARMSRALRILLGLVLLAAGNLAPTPVGAAVPPFSDIDGHPFEADIEWLRLQGITDGCGGGRFCPDASVTRAAMASFLVRAFDLPPSATDPYVDDEGHPAEPDINALAAAGITGGCGTRQFCPTGIVTRGQMAAFLHRAFD